ncbi:hypothetical protein A2U01_0106253, partial [Trifolium medium]|nr:hypothetical protein [Trifolium medium]
RPLLYPYTAVMAAESPPTSDEDQKQSNGSNV